MTHKNPHVRPTDSIVDLEKRRTCNISPFYYTDL
jgi:hypothetical protein